MKTILTRTIKLQDDLQYLQEYLQSIDIIIQDFEQATGNTDDGKAAIIYKQLQKRFDILTTNYSDFLKRCQQISDQCEHYMIMYNEMNHLNEQIVNSMNEFDQTFASNQRVNFLLFYFFKDCSIFRMIMHYKFICLMFNNN